MENLKAPWSDLKRQHLTEAHEYLVAMAAKRRKGATKSVVVLDSFADHLEDEADDVVPDVISAIDDLLYSGTETDDRWGGSRD